MESAIVGLTNCRRMQIRRLTPEQAAAQAWGELNMMRRKTRVERLHLVGH